MPRPENVHELLTLVRQSRLIEGARLETFLAEAHVSDDAVMGPAALLSRMTLEGLLTPYQAGEIAVGRAASFHLGPYRVLDILGRGGMGQVFLCEHTLLGRRVAVKVLSTGLQADPGARRRFAREARAAAALDHPNIVQVFDVEATSEPPYIVMEYIDGMSWQAAVVRHGPFTPAEAAYCGAQAAQGLQGIADAELIHRDIKPANLLIERSGNVKILDLGIVRVTNEASITLEGGSRIILGTLDYLAPEQAVDSSAVDIRADLYALGSTLYFLLAGHPPFPDGEVDEKVSRKMSVDPPRLGELRKDVPVGLAEVIHKLLAREPADRYATPADLATALSSWAEPPVDFPARLFVPMIVSGPELESQRDHGAYEEATPAMATLRIVRPELRTVARKPQHWERDESGIKTGGVDFDSPPTRPIRIIDSDLLDSAPTGRMTPYRIPAHENSRRRGQFLITIATLLIFLSLMTWFFGRTLLGE